MKKQEKVKELKRMNQAGIEKFILEKKARLMQLGFDLAAGKVKNIREIREIKQDVARAKTFLNKS